MQTHAASFSEEQSFADSPEEAVKKMLARG